MATSVNKKVTGTDSQIQYQKRDQVWSLTIDGKTDLIDLDMTDGNNVTITPESDYRKENVLNVSATPTGAGITLTITHGANGTTNNSVITLDASTLSSTLSSLDQRITALGG